MMILRYVQALTAIGVSIVGLGPWNQAAEAQVAPEVSPGPDGVIFALGEVDGYYRDFARAGYEGIHEYECVVGIDCETAQFPDAIYDIVRIPNSYYERSAVAEARIRFNLEDDIDDLTLRLARTGSETAVVQIDDQPLVELPAVLFDPPSRDGGNIGVFDLYIGALDRGEHVVRLTVKSGTGNNGSFGWDAVILGVGDYDD